MVLFNQSNMFLLLLLIFPSSVLFITQRGVYIIKLIIIFTKEHVSLLTVPVNPRTSYCYFKSYVSCFFMYKSLIEGGQKCLLNDCHRLLLNCVCI